MILARYNPNIPAEDKLPHWVAINPTLQKSWVWAGVWWVGLPSKERKKTKCFEFNESLLQTAQFPPSLGVKSPGLYFMHLRFAQRCLAHAALTPILQSGGRWGDCFNGEGWTVWENCWRLEVVDLLHIYIRFVGPPKWTYSSLVKFRTVIQPDCDKIII